MPSGRHPLVSICCYRLVSQTNFVAFSRESAITLIISKLEIERVTISKSEAMKLEDGTVQLVH